jgi:alkanesulfonate monooxygenase SsuD/methylene tetrahydromethanopterin reductase-like flavin-dependent oxidoreductase (luciferase family)
MEFGLFFINEKPPGVSDDEVIANALEQCALADELGYDSVWLGEHHFSPYGTMPDTLLFGAAVAQITKTISIGTAVAVPTFTHPVRVAEQIAMLDVMSGGRFRVGLGRGYQSREFNGYGVPQNESKDRFREAVEIIDGLLTHENFSYDGRFWSVSDLTIAPRPKQKPRPPIYVAGSATPSSTEWLVSKNYRCLTGNPYSLDPGSSDEIGHVLLDEQRRQGKHASLEHAWGLLHNVLVADTDAEAADVFRANWDLSNEYLYTYARVVEEGEELPEDYKYYSRMHDIWAQLRVTDYSDMLAMRGSLIGSPDLVADKLIKLYESTGFTKQLMWMNRGGAVPQKDILRSMELFAEKVIPQVREVGEQDEAAKQLVTAW